MLGKDFVAHIKSNSPDGFFKYPLTKTLTDNASPTGVKVSTGGYYANVMVT